MIIKNQTNNIHLGVKLKDTQDVDRNQTLYQLLQAPKFWSLSSISD